MEVSIPSLELSAADFCAAIVIESNDKKERKTQERACKSADWRDNEGRNPRDCKPSKPSKRGSKHHKHGKEGKHGKDKGGARICEATSNAD